MQEQLIEWVASERSQGKEITSASALCNLPIDAHLPSLGCDGHLVCLLLLVCLPVGFLLVSYSTRLSFPSEAFLLPLSH